MPFQCLGIEQTLWTNAKHLAQRRGAFAIAEAAKVYDCVKIFQKQPQQ